VKWTASRYQPYVISAAALCPGASVRAHCYRAFVPFRVRCAPFAALVRAALRGRAVRLVCLPYVDAARDDLVIAGIIFIERICCSPVRWRRARALCADEQFSAPTSMRRYRFLRLLVECGVQALVAGRRRTSIPAARQRANVVSPVENRCGTRAAPNMQARAGRLLPLLRRTLSSLTIKRKATVKDACVAHRMGGCLRVLRLRHPLG